MIGRALDLRLGEPEPEPEYIVDNLFERGAVVLFAADSGAGKSLLCKDMAVRIIKGEPWLGLKTDGKRVMFIDNENHPRQVRTRFRRLGLTEEEARSSVAYYSRCGVQLGVGSWLERVLGDIEAFDPDLIVLDTVSSTTALVSPPDGSGSMGGGNEAIAYLYATVLRPLAGTTRVLVAQHHEGKPKEGRRDPRHAVLGGMQWYGQADSMLSLRVRGKMIRSNHVRRYPIELELAKDRDGNQFTWPLQIVSQQGPDGRIHTRVKRVEDHGGQG